MKLSLILLLGLSLCMLLPASVVGVPCVSPSDDGCAPVLNWAIYDQNNVLLGDGSVRLSGFTANFGDGSVIPGDGSVRKGDGSVRLGDGSVLPADQWLTKANFGTQTSFLFSFTALSRANPFLDINLSVGNFTTLPLSVVISFNQPLAAGNWTQLEGNSQSTVTDGSGADEGSASVVPQSGFSYIHYATLGGVDVPGAGLGDGCTFVRQLTTGVPTTCDAFSQFALPVSASGPGNFGAAIRFTVSAQDRFESDTHLELNNGAVPEPGTGPLLLFGAATLAATLRRRAR